MPDPVPPTPEPTPTHSKKWWEEFLPLHWKRIVATIILILLTTLINQLLKWAGSDQRVPIPPLPDILFVVPAGTDLDPDTLEELRRRNVEVHFAGWRAPSEEETQATLLRLQSPLFSQTEAGQEIIADGDAPLWRLAFKGRGKPIPVRDQGEVGSCVSFGFAGAVEYTMAAQAALGKERQELPDICQEVIYAGSRVEVNGGRVPFSGDGSTGAWGAKWLEATGGALARGKYGEHDLTEYSVRRAQEWGDRGVPDELEPTARSHQAKCTLVKSAEEARKALAQGYAICVCSNQGFSKTRDSEGFARPQGQWAHAMCIIGYRADRPGFLILNSWGSTWISGPKGKFDDTPDGAFWAETRTVDRMLAGGDSYAVANAAGFKRRKLDPSDWVVSDSQPTSRPFRPEGVFRHGIAVMAAR